jgi:hypothetical protein
LALASNSGSTGIDSKTLSLLIAIIIVVMSPFAMFAFLIAFFWRRG